MNSDEPRQFRFVVRVVDGFDAGRDVCRLHPDAMSALGLKAWDPVRVEGTQATAGLCGHTDWDAPRDTCVLDSLLAVNAGVRAGDAVVVTAEPAQPATAIWVEPVDGEQPSGLASDTLRSALLGKAVLAGSFESLLPQDFNRPFSRDASNSIAALRRSLGADWQRFHVKVISTEPNGVVMVAATTQIHWAGNLSVSRPADPEISIHDLGGMDRQVAELREVVELAFWHSELLRSLGSDGPHGVLIHGPAGSGKTALATCVAAATGVEVVRVDGVDLEYLTATKSAAQIRAALGPARSRPTIVLIESIDRIAPADHEEQGGDAIVLYKQLDRVRDNPNVLVVATTAEPTHCDSKLFEFGRLNRRIEIPMPDSRSRGEILGLQTRSLPLAPDVDLAYLASHTPGFVASDLRRLCDQAALAAATRLKNDPAVGQGALPRVVSADFASALGRVRPSVLGAAAVDTSETTWADVGNAEETKRVLTETVLWPIRYPDTFERLAMTPARGVLMYGPPGCGKTFLVAALANEAEANLIAVKGAEVLSKWVGESEAGVRHVFKRARAAAPSILFFDELDALAPTRGVGSDSGVSDRVVAQLLTELDGIEPLRGVTVVAATNRPDLIDPALLRPGRIERHVFIDPPGADSRTRILRAITRHMPIAPTTDLDRFAVAAEGFSAADLAALAREAGLAALRRDASVGTITSVDFDSARTVVGPSIDAAGVEHMRSFSR